MTTNDHLHLDDSSYFRFAACQRLDKALHTLQGIMAGILIDGKVTQAEIKELGAWCEIDEALKDGVLTADEANDIQWMCANLQNKGGYFDVITADIQRLQGMLHGILADGIIDEKELAELSSWLDESKHLKGCYPYDEIDSLLTSVLKDGKVNDAEQELLKQFFQTFIDYSLSRKIESAVREVEIKKDLTVLGVCSCCPEITFADSVFCMTGNSAKAKRSEIATLIEGKGGIYKDQVTQEVNYLVVGANGNPCWAFSCYGRKIEQAINYRKAGNRLMIIHENDFWDAIQDA
jgi:NAD-dependent DNA ligase